MGKKKLVLVSTTDTDQQYYLDIATGKGFEITEPAEIALEGKRGKTMYGADSPLYGTTYGDYQEFAERYRCECGQLMSRQFEGQVCPVCHTKVKSTPVDLEKTGWMSLGSKKIIAPYYFMFISKLFGKNEFPDIIKRVRAVDKDGNLKDVVPEDYDIKSAGPFYGIGVKGFYDRFDEVIDYYAAKKPAKAESIKALKFQKHKIFTSHIPIYSPMLRPNSTSADTFYYMPIEKIINTLFPLCESIKDCNEIDEDTISWRIQEKVNKMFEQNFELIDGKYGFIRHEILGGELNHTSRNVIVPDPELKIDEVGMSYPAFRELWKFRIIYYIQKFYNCDLSAAVEMWEKSITFNKGVYEIMKMIVKKEEPMIILDRNPTLNYYSVLRMRIKYITESANNYTLKVNLSILPGLNADFDGDILNIIALVDRAFKEMAKNYDPTERMVLDRDTGATNKLIAPTKDLMNNCYVFCCIDKSENDTPQTSTCPEFLDWCKRHNIEYAGTKI